MLASSQVAPRQRRTGAGLLGTISEATDQEVRPGRYGRLLAQGTFYSSALQLSNVSAVLPFICAQLGSMWMAGLLYPAFSIGIIAGHAASPLILGRSRHLKHLVFIGGTGAMGVLIACAAISAQNMRFINTVFLVISAALGIAKGISDGAHAELVSANLPRKRRSQLILGEGAISALVVVTATLLVVPALSDRRVDGGDVTVLWLGAAAMIAAAVAAGFVGPVHAHSAVRIARIREMLRKGVRVVRSERWFRRYAVTQLLFVPVSLGTTFYSLHAAEQSGGTKGLPVLVICASVGVLIGSYLWRAVYRAAGVRGMLVGSSLMAVSAAVACIFGQASGNWSQAWVHGLVFLLAAAADQAVWASAIAWLGMAPEHDRPMLMGFGAAMVALVTSLLGVLLGGIAQDTRALWPVAIVLGMSMIAVAAAIRAPAHA
jgi:hypothetical protein